MDPVSLSLGAVVAGLIAKVLNDGEAKVSKQVWDVVGRLVGAVRRHFREHGSEEDQHALMRLEGGPDSAKALQSLATALDRHQAETSFAEELKAFVKQAEQAGVNIGSLTQTAWGDHNVQIGGVSGSSISINKP